MNVKKLKIVCDDLPVGFTTVAYMYPGEGAWLDPHGGEFTPDEQHQFTSIAEGGFTTVFLGSGTKFAKALTVRFAAEFV